MNSTKWKLLVNYHKIAIDSLARDTLTHLVFKCPCYLLGTGFRCVKAARSSLKIYRNFESFTKHNIYGYKRSHIWYAWEFYQTNQVEIKLMNKNQTQAFSFELKFWRHLRQKFICSWFK